MTINFPNNPGYGEGETSSYTYSSDGIVQSWYWGETGDNPVQAWIPFYSGAVGGGGFGSQGNQGFQGPPGDGEGGGNPQGPEGSVQFADSGSLSGISEVGIFLNSNLNPERGLSANFLHHSESISFDTETKVSGSKSITFGSYNTLVIPNIALSSNETFTLNGLTPSGNTGKNLTLVLGHTGGVDSRIEIANMGIYWANGGPMGGATGGGRTANIYPAASLKKFDILYFFSDGVRIYGNHQTNYAQSID